MKRSRFWLFLALPAVVLVSALAVVSLPENTALGEGSESLEVAVSIAPQRWLVEEIGGPHVQVVTLVSEGVSPATYQPTDAQISRLLRSTAYLYLGLPFEAGQALKAVAQSGRVEMIDMRQGIELRRMASSGDRQPSMNVEHAHLHSLSGHDPHIWLSPRLLIIQARTVADAFARLDPRHAADYQANRERFTVRMTALDQHLREQLEPLRGTSFFIFHPSWGYFADEYGLRQIAVEVEGKEPGEKELTDLQRLARAEDAAVIFVQPQFAGQGAAAVAAAIGGRVEMLDPLAADVAGNLQKAAVAMLRARPAARHSLRQAE